MKWYNVRIIGIRVGEKRETGRYILANHIREFPFSGEGKKNIHLHEAKRTPPKIKKTRPISWHIIVKLASFRAEETTLIAARG